MPTAVGPNTKGEENLVFGYDLGDVSNSYKGEPTTNIVTNTNLDTGWSKGYNKDILVNDYPPPKGIDSQVYSFIDSDGNGSGYWYSYGDYAPQDPSTVYTISLWVRTVGNSFRLQGYTANNSEAGRQYTNSITIPGDGEWHTAEFNALTTPSNTESDSLSFYFPEFPANQRVWICAPQMEPNLHATPFVDGTRSATQGLLDFTGNSTIDLSNVSFDSNAQMTFDGTNDRISIPAGAIPTIGTSDFTMEFVCKNTKTSSYNHFFTVKDQYHFSFKASNSSGILYAYKTSELSTTNTIEAYIPSRTSYYHIVLKRSGDNLEIFINGVSQGTKSGWGNVAIENNLYTSYIGWGNASEYTGGEIPIAKIYSKALSASEIKTNFNAIKGRFNI
jgi:hypothetical protein